MSKASTWIRWTLLLALLLLPVGLASAADGDSPAVKDDAVAQPAADEVVAQAPATSGGELPAWLAPEEVATRAFCQADCMGAGTASCTGTTCTAVNRNCSAAQPGYARCDGVTYWCNPCPGPTCNPSCKLVCAPTGGKCVATNTCACY